MSNENHNSDFFSFMDKLVLIMGLIMYLLFTWNWIKAMFHCYSYSADMANLGISINVILAIVFLINRIERYCKQQKDE